MYTIQYKFAFYSRSSKARDSRGNSRNPTRKVGQLPRIQADEKNTDKLAKFRIPKSSNSSKSVYRDNKKRVATKAELKAAISTEANGIPDEPTTSNVYTSSEESEAEQAAIKNKNNIKPVKLLWNNILKKKSSDIDDRKVCISRTTENIVRVSNTHTLSGCAHCQSKSYPSKITEKYIKSLGKIGKNKKKKLYRKMFEQQQAEVNHINNKKLINKLNKKYRD